MIQKPNIATAYKAMIGLLLEYACVVWSPHAVKDVNLLEAVQRRAARWVCGSHWNQITHSWSIPHDVCAIESCVYHPYLPGGTICQCVLFKTFVMLVLLSFQTIVHTTLCLRVAIILPSYSHLHQSMLDDQDTR